MGLKPVRVSQLNSYIKRIMQNDPILGSVSVVGEVSNLKFHGTGHVYFSLKDESSRINCFLPSGNVDRIDCDLREGMEVIADGYIYVYERGGSYSLNIRNLQEAGRGRLAEEFEKLKRRLEEEGLFDREHKQELPSFPGRLAIVTSETGAAVRDILKIIKNKNDYVDILIYPVLVQGPGAASQIAAAIDDLNRSYDDIDLIITGRGGGSMEELWAFNEEIVARSIYNSRIPVISAVGHEIDFTIADFVADMRAETPTAAAEAAVPDTFRLRETLTVIRAELARELDMALEKRIRQLQLLDPQSFGRDIQSRIAMEQMRGENMIADMEKTLRAMTASKRSDIELLRSRIEAADPRAIMARGYSVITDDEGHIIRRAADLSQDQLVRIELAEGRATARISDIDTNTDTNTDKHTAADTETR